MRLSQMRDLRRTLDDRWTSPVADTAAALWGCAPGTARFWRSSACHVFALVDEDQVGGYLRLTPVADRGRADAEAVADLMRRLGGVGAVGPVPTRAATVVETVHTAIGEMHAMVVPVAPGDLVEVDDLDPARAREWGAALAALHDQPCAGLRRQDPDLVATAGRWRSADPVLADAVDALASWVDGLPVGLDRTGLVHGDFELDNLRWDGTTVRSFDYDEAGCGLLLRDVASALRDLEARDDLRAAFLAGYGVDVPPAALAVFRALQSVVTLIHLEGTLDAGGPGDPLDEGEEWLARLHAAVTARQAGERERLLTVASR